MFDVAWESADSSAALAFDETGQSRHSPRRERSQEQRLHQPKKWNRAGMPLLDGMCRPNLYQDFVFVDGKFARTLSPSLMNARSDGASQKVRFRHRTRFSCNSIDTPPRIRSAVRPVFIGTHIKKATTNKNSNRQKQPLLDLKSHAYYFQRANSSKST